MAYQKDPTRLFFCSIPTIVASVTVVKRHYLHRPPPISWAFGAYIGNRLKGVLTVGNPPSWSLQCGLVGARKEEFKNLESRAHDVYELNRLWMHDGMPQNSESRFMGWCLRALRKLYPGLILVSYADTKHNHTGVIYQATNWIYTGTSKPFLDMHPKGYSYRNVPISVRGKKIGNKREWAFDPNIPRVPRSIKHRYVWFANPGDQALLAWKVEHYPTNEKLRDFFVKAGATGGKIAARKMTAQERVARARKAAAVRWGKFSTNRITTDR